MNKLIYILFFLIIPLPAFAYIGPAVGGGAIVALIGFLAAFFLVLWGILYFPIKRAIRNRKNKVLSKDMKK